MLAPVFGAGLGVGNRGVIDGKCNTDEGGMIAGMLACGGDVTLWLRLELPARQLDIIS